MVLNPEKFLKEQGPERFEDLMGRGAPSTEAMSEVSAQNAAIEKEIGKLLEEIEVDAETKLEGGEFLQVDPLAKFVWDAFKENESARKETEQRWLDDLRQYRGEYAPEVMARMDPNRSKAFVRLTTNKVKTVDSRLSDFLFPANGDKNWSIRPTPMPDYNASEMQQIVAMYKQESGQDITPEQLQIKVIERATTQAKKMEKVIEDQLSELRYREIAKDVIHSGDIFGTGWLKGPLASIIENRQYYKDFDEAGNAKWLLQQFDKVTPFCEFAPLWDVYPDMSATRVDDCRNIIQRRKMEKNKLLRLAKRSDFSGDIIRKYIEQHHDGDLQDKYFETELKSMGNINTVNPSGSASSGKKYEVLEFWGYVDVEDLRRSGVEIPEKMKDSFELAANIWVLGQNVIKASLVPLEGVKWPFYAYYYDKDETSIFGHGIPHLMRDIQELINASFRAMLDNAAISAGPQIEVNLDLLSEDEDPTDVRPFKVWTRTGEGLDAGNQAVRIMQFPSYTTNYLQMCEAFEKYGDEVTTIPRYMWGEQAGGAGRTASGLSMMMGSANITIKDQVKSFDDGITKPFITAMYHWNMQFNEDESVKGDYGIVASGTTSLIAKEVYTQSLMNFANITNNPVDLPIVKRANIVRAIAESLDLSDKNLVYSDQEIQANNQQQAKQQQDEKAWMLKMTEAAREYGVSPVEMIEGLRSIKSDMDQAVAQQQQQQQSPQQGMR